ncbi:MAG: ABC-F family ATP-binding cassette domain-containing protein [Planctomycetota bacterium]
MTILSLDNVTKSLGGRLLLDGVSVTVNAGSRVGIIGANGTGKTTLFRIISGDLEPDQGRRTVARATKIVALAQREDVSTENTLLDELLTSRKDIVELEHRLQTLEKRLAESPSEDELEQLVEKQSRALEEFERAGGYDVERRAEAILMGLGFHRDRIRQPARGLSEGEKGRVSLGKLLFEEDALLLLDEPTNHLDIHTVSWLEDFLRKYAGTVLVISHDRRFLDNIATHIVELEHETLTMTSGNYSSWEQQKAKRREIEERAFKNQQRHLAKEEEFIRRNMAGQKTNMAKSRLKRLEKVDRLQAPGSDPSAMKVDFGSVDRGGEHVLTLEDLTLRVGERTLVPHLDLELFKGEKIGIVGSNGCGKSTLLKTILGERMPDGGRVKLGQKTKVGYYDQDLSGLRETATPFEEIRAARRDLDDEDVRSHLGRFLFTGDDVDKSISVLSGGERARVALARIVLTEANCLVLDEPTNHLDIYARANLERALKDYPGTVLVVSHDRQLLDGMCSKILAFEKDGRVRVHHGTFRDYVERTEKEEAEAQEAARKSAEKAQAQAPKTQTAKGKPRDRVKRRHTFEQLEAKIIETEERLSKVREAMYRPENYQDAAKMKRLQGEEQALASELKELESEWETWA